MLCMVWTTLILLLLEGGPYDRVGVAGHAPLTVLGAQSCNGNFFKGALGLGQELLLQSLWTTQPGTPTLLTHSRNMTMRMTTKPITLLMRKLLLIVVMMIR